MSTMVIAPNREERVLDTTHLEFRAVEGEKMPLIVGYASVFNEPSEIISDWSGKFREYVSPGAFTKTLKDGADVRALVNHNPDFILGRTKSGTLSLKEDGKGLWMEIHPPEARWVEDLITTMRRGDIDGSSFAFQTIRDRWGTGKDDAGIEIDERHLLEARLFDVSVVTYPAYPQTEAQVRSLLRVAGLDVDAIGRIVLRAERGLPLQDGDRSLLGLCIEKLRTYLPLAEPTSTGHSATSQQEPTRTGHSLEESRRMLQRIERLAR